MTLEKDKLLVVDDEKINLKLVEKILGEDAFDIDFAMSGEEGLKLLMQDQYILVLLDVHLPGINGFETCKKIHKIKPELPVIIMTAASDSKPIKSAFEAGATDYVSKPFRKEELIARVNNVILNFKNAEKARKLYDEIMLDLDIASKMQLYIIPEQLILNKNFLVSSVYEPSVKVSGDIFDIIPINEQEYVFYIGDVSGHGVKSALLMTAVRASIRMLVEMNKTHIEPHDIVNKLNQSMCDTFFKENYMTLLLGRIDLEHQIFEYCNAGHPPIIEHKIETNQTIVLDDCGELPVGWMKDYTYSESETNNIQFDADSILFFYTDGIFECEDQNGNELDISGLVKSIGKFANKDNIAILPHILHNDLLSRGYDLHGDDVTFVSLKYRDEETLRSYPHYSYFKLDPNYTEVAIVAKKCEKAVSDSIQDEMLGAQIELALVEILNNIIEHGFKDGLRYNLKITMEMNITDHEIMVKIWDCGILWSPGIGNWSINVEEMDRKNQEYSNSGRGLDILKEILDEFSVRNFQGINETTLKIKLNNDLEP